MFRVVILVVLREMLPLVCRSMLRFLCGVIRILVREFGSLFMFMVIIIVMRIRRFVLRRFPLLVLVLCRVLPLRSAVGKLRIGMNSCTETV